MSGPTIRERIEALRPWPEGEPLIRALLVYEETVTRSASPTPNLDAMRQAERAARAAAPPVERYIDADRHDRIRRVYGSPDPVEPCPCGGACHNGHTPTCSDACLNQTIQHAARAAAPPVEPPCAVCGDPKAKHDTDSTIAPHDYVPPSPDPVAGLREAAADLERIAKHISTRMYFTDPITPPHAEDIRHDDYDRLTEVAASIRSLVAENKVLRDLAEPVPLPNHPDDGHPHSWGCRRCGVDPAEPVPLDVERLGQAMDTVYDKNPGVMRNVADAIAAEYARLTDLKAER